MKRFRGVASLAAVIVFVPATNAEAAPLPCVGGDGDEFALSAVIEVANGTPLPDVIELAPGCVYSFTSAHSSVLEANDFWYGPAAVPAIASPITIEGNGAVIERSAGAATPFRLFFVGADPVNDDTLGYASPGPGDLTIRNVTLRGGLAKGGDSGDGGGGAGLGGAIYNQGLLTLEGSTLTQNTAQGGNADGTNSESGGAGIGADALGAVGRGFGELGAYGGGSGGGGAAPGAGAGGGGGFRPDEDGAAGGPGSPGGNGGGPPTGVAGASGGSGSGGNGGGGGGSASLEGGSGGAFSQGGVLGGGGGVGGGGGANATHGGGGGFGGGGAMGNVFGGDGGFGAGGGAGPTPGEGGFGGGAGSTTAGGGGAGMGGAIFNHQGTVTIRNSTLSGNSVVGGDGGAAPNDGERLGGALFNLNGTVTVDSSTISGNTGGGAYNLGYLGTDPGHSYAATLTVDNSILADSGVDVDSAGPPTLSGGVGNTVAPTADLSAPNIVELFTGTGFVGAPLTEDPQLGPLADNEGSTQTHAITSASPAFNAGDTPLITDQRGVARPQGTADDIGAFELGVTEEPPPGDGGDPDTTAPETSITKKPKKRSTKRKATIEFSSSESGASFACKVDRKDFASCSSPLRIKRLKPGKHKVQVVATDAAGNADPTPAVAKFKTIRR
jgi:hypothetical protein